MINNAQLESMLDLQNTMNSTVNPEWVNLEWDWMRASCLEACEAVEHHGWKWWKHQEKDVPQLQMEIVDIWHFYLSQYIKKAGGNTSLALNMIVYDYEHEQKSPVLFDAKPYDLTSLDLLKKLDLLIGLSAAKRTSLKLFFSILEDCGLNWAMLFEQYVKKNLLNIFRQKNGYKQGTYHKTWFDQEDNVFLVSESAKLDPTQPDYVEELWNSLERVYKEALEFQAKK